MNNHIKENANKGFSLVELIVVIAIMAVMTSVLAPSLLGYVEKSRMQKDDSAMGEVANAIKLALADQDVYDECLIYNVRGNHSCYTDTASPTATKIIDKCYNGVDHTDDSDAQHYNIPCTASGTVKADAWHYDSETRLADEVVYQPNGSMRGMTLTFAPEFSTNAARFVLGTARVNEIVSGTIQGGGTATTLNEMTTGAAGKNAMLYNKLRAVIGDNITLSSQTYRNSEYTVFIRMGSMGGNQASAQDAVDVYGQWNGTNLTEDLY